MKDLAERLAYAHKAETALIDFVLISEPGDYTPEEALQLGAARAVLENFIEREAGKLRWEL